MEKILTFFEYKNKASKRRLNIFSNPGYDTRNEFYYKNHPWNNRAKYKLDYKYVLYCEKKLSNEIVKQFKKKYNIRKSKKFWNIIFFPSLYHAISHIRSKFLILEKIYKNEKIKKFFLPNYNLKNFVPKNTNDMLNYIKDVNFNIIINCEIAKFFFNPKKVNKKIILSKSQNFDQVLSKKIKILKILKPWQKKTLVNETYLNYNSLRFIDSKNFFFDDNFKPKFKFKKINRDNIFKFKNLSNNKNFYNIVRLLIKYYIPESIIENINDTNEKYINLKNIVTGAQIKNDDNFKKFCAYKIENKTNLYIIQHGGDYNTSTFNPSVDKEKKISKLIYWKKENGYDLSATKLISRKLVNNLNSNKIIFFAQNYRFIINHFGDGPYPPKQNIKFQINQFKSIENLMNTPTFKIYVKTPNYFEKKFQSLLQNLLINKKTKIIDPKKKIDEILSDFVFAVTHDPGTIFLELLGLNYPCFLIKDKAWNLNSKFKGHLNKLKKLNIVFNSSIDLLKYLKKTNWERNWMKAQKHPDFLSFKRNYCYYDNKNSLSQWKLFMNKL